MSWEEWVSSSLAQSFLIVVTRWRQHPCLWRWRVQTRVCQVPAAVDTIISSSLPSLLCVITGQIITVRGDVQTCTVLSIFNTREESILFSASDCDFSFRGKRVSILSIKTTAGELQRSVEYECLTTYWSSRSRGRPTYQPLAGTLPPDDPLSHSAA